jgi:hypothetical protein
MTLNGRMFLDEKIITFFCDVEKCKRDTFFFGALKMLIWIPEVPSGSGFDVRCTSSGQTWCSHGHWNHLST